MENIEFSFSDAWVLTALYSSHRDLDNLDFSGIIAAGDGLNNAILSAEEIRNAFIKFQSTGLIEKLSTKIEYSEKGKELIQQCLETKGGQFSRIEITLRKLRKVAIENVEDINDCRFVDSSLIDKAFKKYKSKLMK